MQRLLDHLRSRMQCRNAKRIALRMGMGVMLALTSLPYFAEVSPASAATDNAMRIEGKLRPNGGRVMFYCQQPVGFTVAVSGTTVEVTFDRSFSGSAGALPAKLQGLVTGASFGGGGKKITLSLAPGQYQTRKFVSDKFVGIDIIKAKDNAKLPVPPPVAEKKKLPPAELPLKKEAAAPAAKQPVKVVPPKEKTLPVKLSPLTPANAAKTKPEKPVAVPVKKVLPKPVEKIVKLPAPPQEHAQRKNPPLAVTVVKNADAHSIIFPWKKDVSAAIFTRAGTLWIVFDQPYSVATTPLVSALNRKITDLQQLPSNQYTILRAHGVDIDNIRISKQQFTWNIDFMDAGQPPQPLRKRISQYKTPYSKGVFFPADNVAVPLHVTDPDVQDELIIFPLADAGSGIAAQRQFVDFTIFQSAQGVAMTLLGEKVHANRIESGIEILAPVENLSKEVIKVDHVQPATLTERISLNNLFPFEKWLGDPDKTFNQNQQSFFNNVLSTDRPEKSDKQLELAQFYFASGLIPETMGMLKVIRQSDPYVANLLPFKLLYAAACVRANRLAEAKMLFDALPVTTLSADEKQELKFWQSALQVMLKTPTEQLDYLGNKDKFLRNYPPRLQQNFALLALESQLRNNNFIEAEKLLTLLEAEDPQGTFKNSLQYFKGVLSAKKREDSKAMRYWEPLTKDIDDRMNRARAGLAQVQLLLTTEKITSPQAIERLNAIRSGWRGDDIEKDILRMLGEQYVITKQYADALRSWRQVIHNFSSTEDALLLEAKMTRLFIYVFSDAGSATISDLSALALYYEFREITPIGRSGDLIIQQLAYRLIKLDLLDRAAALLTHQVKYRLKDKERLDFGTKLAVVHMLNKKPALALEALDGTEGSAKPADANERLYLRAKALIALKKSPQALTLISKIHTPEADRIRLDIAWDTTNWNSIIFLLAPSFNERNISGKVLTVNESNDLLRLAIAYIMQGNQQAMTKLYADYQPLFPPGSPLVDTFKFLATDKGAVNYKDLDKSLDIATSQSFVDKYRQLIQKDSLAMPAPKPETPAKTTAADTAKEGAAAKEEAAKEEPAKKEEAPKEEAAKEDVKK
jgi:hypothetical protein